MFGLHGPRALEHGQEADHIGVDVALRVLDAVADAGLGPEVDDAARRMLGEQRPHAVAVGEVEGVVDVVRLRLEPLEPGVFECRVVVVVEVVDADHRLAARQQALGGVEADEAG